MMLPLKGITVLDLTTLLPGPLCSMMLGDFGAEVIKIEQPKGGDLARMSKPALKDKNGVDTSGMYLLINRNKKSLTVNLRTEEGKQIFYQLAKTADVVLEGSRPGVAKKLGVDYETLKAINPRLVYCSISGYGQDGPYALQSGHDINYLAYAGVLGMTGRNGMPTLPGVQIADVGGGTLMATIGILLSLMARQHSGQGQFVDISMLDGAISWLPIIAAHLFAGGESPVAGQTKLTGRNACYEVYQTKDGGYMSIGAIEPHLWSNLCKYLGREEFIAWQNEDTKQEQIFAFLREQFLLHDRDEWNEILQKVDVCAAPVYNLAEVFQDPQVLHRKMVFEMEHPRLGKIKQLGFPVKLSDTPAQAELPPPDLGGNTDEILTAQGFSVDEIRHLREQGIV
jgi:crotonobetainyl-CoA:carnitine CoA-transferase CaiB-like acyl-CoA transferase